MFSTVAPTSVSPTNPPPGTESQAPLPIGAIAGTMNYCIVCLTNSVCIGLTVVGLLLIVAVGTVIVFLIIKRHKGTFNTV